LAKAKLLNDEFDAFDPMNVEKFGMPGVTVTDFGMYGHFI
jgi:hypothetical protein